MPYYVYVLKSLSKGASYVGHTINLEKRFEDHNNGKSKSTRGKRPWRIVYQEELDTRSDAVRREMYFKSVDGRKELKGRGVL